MHIPAFLDYALRMLPPRKLRLACKMTGSVEYWIGRVVSPTRTNVYGRRSTKGRRKAGDCNALPDILYFPKPVELLCREP
jgi:hypothetical protein